MRMAMAMVDGDGMGWPDGVIWPYEDGDGDGGWRWDGMARWGHMAT